MRCKFYDIYSVALVLTVLLCGLYSCQGNHSKIFESDEDTIMVDSLQLIMEQSDTLALDADVKAGKIPMSMDETFDDFIYGFDQSNRLQRERTVFPLEIKSFIKNNNKQIETKDWHHHYVFMGQDYTTSLWNSREQMSLLQDTTLMHAYVEKIYLQTKEIYNYHFGRSTDGKWMLKYIEQTPYEDHILVNFFNFYNEWVSDSIYQIAHIASSITYSTLDENSDEMIVGTIDAAQWQMFAPMLPKDVITNVNYGQRYNNMSQILFQMRGLNNGLESLFTFSQTGDSWELTAFEN